jgi:hypothetical protein
MSEKKLFTVRVWNEIVVVAEDEDDAQSVAISSLRDVGTDGYSAHASPMRYLPARWEPNAIPYGDGDKAECDCTIRQWIELGAAPEYRVQR